MIYNPPVGGGSSDPYVTGDPATDTPGSIPPGASIEHPQREIVNVILAAGLTPSGANLAQLLAALNAGWNLSKNLAASGHLVLPGGLLINWGQSSSIGGLGSTTVTYDLAFSIVYAYSATPVVSAGTGSGQTAVAAQNTTFPLSKLDITRSDASGATCGMSWIAVGKP